MQGEDKHWGMAHDLMPLLTTVLSVKLSWPTSGISSAANQYIYLLTNWSYPTSQVKWSSWKPLLVSGLVDACYELRACEDLLLSCCLFSNHDVLIREWGLILFCNEVSICRKILMHKSICLMCFDWWYHLARHYFLDKSFYPLKS